MNAACDSSKQTIMLTQLTILTFSCTSCNTRLQAANRYSGHFAQCPKCGNLVLAPEVKTLNVTIMPMFNGKVAESANSLMGRNISHCNHSSRRASTSTVKLTSNEPMSSLTILADNAISQEELEKKENVNFIRMCLLFFVVALVIIAVSWLLKSFSQDGFVRSSG